MSDQTQLIQQLEKRLRILEDKEALATVLNQYCKRADDHDFKGHAATYAEDGKMCFENWGEIIGREGIEKAASAEMPFEGLQHSMTNMQFEVDGSDRATGTAYLWFVATPETNKPDVHYAFGGPYRFEFKRAQEGWQITSMRLKKIWAQGRDTLGVFGA